MDAVLVAEAGRIENVERMLFRDAPVMAQGHSAAVDVEVIRQQEAAFDAGHDLRTLHAETARRAEGADLLALVGGAVGVRAVFDHLQLVLLRNLHDGVHVAGLAPEMDEHDALRLLGDVALDVGGIDLAGVRQDVGEDGRAPTRRSGITVAQ